MHLFSCDQWFWTVIDKWLLMSYIQQTSFSASLLHSEMKTQQPLHVATPVRQSLALTKVAGTSVYLKLDSSQPTGSFKIRGIGHLCKTVSNSPSVPWWCDGVICPVASTCGFKILDCDFSFWISPVGRARMWAFCLLFRWAAKKKQNPLENCVSICWCV